MTEEPEDLGIKVEPKEVAYWIKVKEQAEEAVYQSYKEIKINGRIACLAIEEIKKEKDLSKSVDK